MDRRRPLWKELGGDILAQEDTFDAMEEIVELAAKDCLLLLLLLRRIRVDVELVIIVIDWSFPSSFKRIPSCCGL